MKEIAEEALNTVVWKSLAIFLEGSVNLYWITEAIGSSGVRGDDLTKILSSLRRHGDPKLYHAISTVCLKRGWIGDSDESTPPTPPTDPPLALIIEDHKDAAAIFANTMQGAGFETEIIDTGDAALTRLIQTTPAVVILDLHLPRISGVEILRWIRADAHLAGVYVIVATAYPDMAKGVSEKADQAFLKPVSYVQLHDLALYLGFKYTGRMN